MKRVQSKPIQNQSDVKTAKALGIRKVGVVTLPKFSSLLFVGVFLGLLNSSFASILAPESLHHEINNQIFWTQNSMQRILVDPSSQQRFLEYQDNSQWKLLFMTLGLGVRATIGVPHIFNFSPSIKTLFTFQLKDLHKKTQSSLVEENSNWKYMHGFFPSETETLWIPRTVQLEKASLPKNWFQKPEELDFNERTNLLFSSLKTQMIPIGNPFLPPGHDTGELILNSFEAIQNSLDRHTQDQYAWKWITFGAGFGVNMGGLLGIGYLGTESSLFVSWLRNHEKPPERTINEETHRPSSPSGSQSMTINVQGIHSPKELWKELEKPYLAALATRRITSPANFKSQLYKVGENFWHVSHILESMKLGPDWYPNAYILNVSVNGMGQVTPATAIGGVVSISFSWKRDPRFLSSPESHLSKNEPHFANNLRQFIHELSEDISQVIANHRFDYPGNLKNGFEPSRVLVGLGINGRGDVGIAHIGGNLNGHISFLRRRTTKRNSIAPESNSILNSSTLNLSTQPQPINKFENQNQGKIILFEENPSPKTLSFANRLNIPFSKSFLGNEFFFDLRREAFRRGLAHGLKIENYFAERAAELASEEWSIYDLTTAFSLSIGGDFVLVTVAGTESVAISFSRQPTYIQKKNRTYVTPFAASNELEKSPGLKLNPSSKKPFPTGLYLENKILDLQQSLAETQPQNISRSEQGKDIPRSRIVPNLAEEVNPYRLFFMNLMIAPGITFGFHTNIGITLSPFFSFTWVK